MKKQKAFIREGVILALTFFAVFVSVVFYFYNTKSEPLKYFSTEREAENPLVAEIKIPIEPPKRIVTHIKTPESVKAVYMSSWVAGSPEIRKTMIKLIEETELNAVIIDVKDSTGRVAFVMEDPIVKNTGSYEKRIGDVENLIDILHEKNIYVIARIAAFQDPYLANKRPDISPFRKSDGKLWKDYKGLAWVEPASEEVWDYLVAIGKESYNVGFDELNFDYIRFPSDGNMAEIRYRFYDSAQLTKAEQMRRFFEYLNKELKPLGVPLSADLFGMTMTNSDDLNIGQVLENTLPYFDFVAPMVYPSHYPTGFHGYKNPASVPYEIIKISMDEGVRRAVIASTSPNKLRPWLQDFDLGATYTADMVRAQMKATYDSGLNSWMLWDPSNKYTPAALIKEVAQIN